ncbi:hypothetical protein [Priestia megaterium]|uniref:hypothetical protein n=1 Tax=Priestia megaterium TaxID=1404 RepID=UPI003000574F
MPEEEKPTVENEDKIHIDWNAVLQKGLEAAASAFGEAFGGPIGGALANLIVSGLFDSGSEDKFGDAIRDLKESMREEINNAFLRDTTASVLGLGVNLRSYFTTKDQAILTEIQNDITQEIEALLSKENRESDEALVTVVYAINVYILTLRAKADYNQSFYEVIKEATKSYSERVTEFANAIEAKYKNKIPAKCFVSIEKADNAGGNWQYSELRPALCTIKGTFHDEVKSGFNFKYKAWYYAGDDNHNIVPYREFIEERCEVLPFRSKDGYSTISDSDDLLTTTSSAIKVEDREASKAFADCEKYRTEQTNAFLEKLNQYITPVRTTVELWKTNVIDALEEKL